MPRSDRNASERLRLATNLLINWAADAIKADKWPAEDFHFHAEPGKFSETLDLHVKGWSRPLVIRAVDLVVRNGGFKDCRGRWAEIKSKLVR